MATLSLAKIRPKFTAPPPFSTGSWKVCCQEWSVQARPGTAVLRDRRCEAFALFEGTYGAEQGDLSADDVTDVIEVVFERRPGAIAQSLAFREPQYQETAAYCHRRRGRLRSRAVAGAC